MTLRNKPQWIDLAQTPFEKFSNIVCIDDDNIMIAPWISQSQQSDGLYIYNSITDQWDLFMTYPNDFKSTYHTMEYNNASNELLLFGRSSHILFVNVSVKQYQTYVSNKFIGDYPSITAINNKYHIIGGSFSNNHFLWSKKTPKLRKSSGKIVWKTAHQKHGAIVLKNKQKLLVFGGVTNSAYGNIQYSDQILFYSLKLTKNTNIYKKRSWKQLKNIKLPKKMEGFGYILTNDEEYLILFGGINNSKEYYKKFMKTIWVLNLIEMKWRKSKCKCPTKGAMRATLMSNKRDTLLIYGYLKQIQFMEHIIPLDIINLLTKWYSSKYVHLLDNFNGNHWKISLHEILSNMKL